MPNMESLVAFNLHPNQRLSMMSGSTLPYTKANCLQPALAYKSYKPIVTMARALNAPLHLQAYLAELQKQITTN